MFAFMTRQPGGRRFSVIALVVMGALMVACSGPAEASKAAVIDGQTISMDQYLTLVRYDYQTKQSSGASGWQTPAGRTYLAGVQQEILTTLMLNPLLDETAKKNGISLTTIKNDENTQLQQLFAQELPADIKVLVDEGVINKDILRPLIHQRVAIQALVPKLAIDTADIHVITVPTLKLAQDLQKQLQDGGDWVKLSLDNSTDKAKANGGTVTGMPPGVFPNAIDDVIFSAHDKDGKLITPDPKTITIVKSRLGYSLVQVTALTRGTTLDKLDSSTPIFANTSSTSQSVAFQGYLNTLYTNAEKNIYVNWCNNTAGKPCPALLPDDQV